LGFFLDCGSGGDGGRSASISNDGGDGGGRRGEVGGSSMTRRESIHVGGLCSRSEIEMYHEPGLILCCPFDEPEATKKVKHHKRPE
jgi:hypothetical protein